ncbi:MAG: hypothetical protein AAF502_18615 [Bacteroidota bacterium]
MHTITIKDETAVGKVLNEIQLAFENEFITVEELIKQRVFHEVNQFNNKGNEMFSGLVQPTDTEVALNGFKMKNRRKVDKEKQVYIALNAFKKNGFFIIVDNQQVDKLEDKVLVSGDTDVSFIKLTPLVGG